jgi:hypothetical protein
MVSDSQTITEEDVAGLNQRAVLRVADIARRCSTGLLVVAGVIALAWLWQTLRYQGVITDENSGGFSISYLGDEDLTWKQRVDALTLTMSMLGFAGALAGIGVGLRVYCEVTTLRVGGSLTGWNVGDPIEDDEAEPVDLDPT